MTARLLALIAAIALLITGARAGDPQQVADAPEEAKSKEAKPPVLKAEEISEARDKGLAWLAKNQKEDGSWGGTYSIAVTSFATLSYLSASDEPFRGERGKSLLRALKFLMSKQTDGLFISQGHTWVHGQGFGTLALSEAYGRSLTCKTKPDFDMEKTREVVGQAVKVIGDNQSTSGGWWYKPGTKSRHEGSTTCCATQALVSAANYGIEIDRTVLAQGFEYLKKCQNKDGGFDYQMGPGETSMKEGTAGGVATLGLMRKFDYSVMMNGYKFLIKITPHEITQQRFPYYGHFYGVMGMRLLGQEMKHLREKTMGYTSGALRDLVAWQQEDGAWPKKGSSNGGAPYSTAYSTLTLSIPDGRLSVFNRVPPKLAKE